MASAQISVRSRMSAMSVRTLVVSLLCCVTIVHAGGCSWLDWTLGRECCGADWINDDFTQLEKFFSENLYGQHLTREVILKNMKHHIQDDDPPKPLVLSFHGSPGVGKSYTSMAIANSLYKLGMDSKFVHLIAVTRDSPHEANAKQYHDKLQHWVSSNVTSCERSLFIIDEMHKIPPGVVDGIIPFIKSNQIMKGINHRKAIFIFTGNNGMNVINLFVLHQWESGRDRTDIKHQELASILQNNLYNEEGALWHSSMLDSGFISIFVPFLPLEHGHVRQCIKTEFKRRKLVLTETKLAEIAEEFTYFPTKLKLYSNFGCRPTYEFANLHEEL